MTISRSNPSAAMNSCHFSTIQIRKTILDRGGSKNQKLLERIEKLEQLLESAIEATKAGKLDPIDVKAQKLLMVLTKVNDYTQQNDNTVTSFTLYRMTTKLKAKLNKFEKSLVNAGIVTMKLKNQAKSIFSKGSNSTVFIPDDNTRDKSARSLSFSDESDFSVVGDIESGTGELLNDEKDSLPASKPCVKSASEKIHVEIQTIIDNIGSRSSWQTIMPKLETYSKQAAKYSVGLGNVLITGNCAVISRQSFVHNVAEECSIFTFLYPMRTKIPATDLAWKSPRNCAEAAKLIFSTLKKLVPESYLTVFSVSKNSSIPMTVGLDFSYYVLGDFICIAFLSVGALSAGSRPLLPRHAVKSLASGISLKNRHVWDKKVSGLNMTRYSVGKCVKTGELVLLATPRWKGVKSNHICIDSFWAFSMPHIGLMKLSLNQTPNSIAECEFDESEIVKEIYVL